MFKPEPLVYLEAVILKQDERAVLKEIGKIGAVHLEKTRSGYGDEAKESTELLSIAQKIEQLQGRILELRQMLNLPFSEKTYKPQEMTVEKAEEIFNEIDNRCKELITRRHELIQKQKEIRDIIERYTLLSGYELPLLKEEQFTFLHFVVGSIPVNNLEGLENLKNKTVTLPLTRIKDRQYLFLVTAKSEREEIDKFLEQIGFQKEILPALENTMDSFLEKERQEYERITEELNEVERKIENFKNEYRDILDEIEGYINLESRIINAGQKFLRTEATITLSGWVPSKELGLIEKTIKETTKNRYILNVTAPDRFKEAEIPVLIKHSRLLRPFEMLVSAYGLPTYNELVPTLFVALSYVVMFGMMFGDVGHGLVLGLLGLFALIKGRSIRVRDSGILLMSVGISSIVFGIIYGSYFGIEELKKYAIWHDPIDCDPIKLMYIAISIGIVLISIGLILNAINNFLRGNIIGGFLDKFGLVGVVFYWGAIILILKGSTLKSQGLFNLFLIVFIMIPIVGWAIKEPLEHIVKHKRDTHEKSEEGIGVAIMESCVGAFEAILSYLANTISFVRLAAYAMSHAALLFAAFMVAKELKGIPYVGGGLSIFIIILGNIVAIVLEGIIASVQALRLEYYEFFGKFFSGSGKAFEPFYLPYREERESYKQ